MDAKKPWYVEEIGLHAQIAIIDYLRDFAPNLEKYKVV
jgi:hypothetical protein